MFRGVLSRAALQGDRSRVVGLPARLQHGAELVRRLAEDIDVVVAVSIYLLIDSSGEPEFVSLGVMSIAQQVESDEARPSPINCTGDLSMRADRTDKGRTIPWTQQCSRGACILPRPAAAETIRGPILLSIISILFLTVYDAL